MDAAEEIRDLEVVVDLDLDLDAAAELECLQRNKADRDHRDRGVDGVHAVDTDGFRVSSTDGALAKSKAATIAIARSGVIPTASASAGRDSGQHRRPRAVEVGVQ